MIKHHCPLHDELGGADLKICGAEVFSASPRTARSNRKNRQAGLYGVRWPKAAFINKRVVAGGNIVRGSASRR